MIGTVAGGSWSTTCAGKAVSGKTWYAIKQINGTSVSSLYGVSTVYAASGLLVNWRCAEHHVDPVADPTPKPTPTPTPKPTPTPTPVTSPSPGETSAPTPTPTFPPTNSYWEGIDVSHWQGTIDWAKVKTAGKRFAYMKASESTDFIDDHYATNRAQAKAQGIKVGAYHFARPSTTSGDAVAEANWFIKNAAPVSGELIPVLDLEVTGGLTDAQLASWTKAFMDRVYTLTGIKGAIYVSPSFWTNNVGNSTGAGHGWLQGPVDRPLDDRPRADHSRQQLGRQLLDLLAVHVQRHREWHRRPRGPQPLQVHDLDQGPHPVGRSRTGTPRPSPMLRATWTRAARQPRARRTTAGTG